MKVIIINLIWMGVAVGAFFWGKKTGGEETKTIVERQVIQNQGQAAISPIGSGVLKKADAQASASLDKVIHSTTEISSADIGSAIADILKIPDKVDRSLKFAEMLRQLTPENAEAAYVALKDNIKGMERYQHMNLLFHAWGGVDPENAIKAASESGGRGKGFAIASTVSGWAASDIDAAAAWVESQEGSPQQGFYQRSLISTYAQQDPAAATDFVLKMETDDKSRYIEMIATHQASNPDQATSWAMSIPAGDLQSSAISSLARSQARDDPAAAAGWLTSLPDNPASSGYREVFRSWGREDPTAASTYLTEMGNSPSKDSAIRSFASTVAAEDPESATAWVATIEDEGQRSSAMVEVGQRWYKESPDEALQWAENSGLDETSIEKMKKGPERRDDPWGRRR